MSLNFLAERRLREIEEELSRTDDSIERILTWFMFIKDFSKETQGAYTRNYEEFVHLCEAYVGTPDPGIRAELKKQIKLVALELQHFNSILRRVSTIQKRLESEIVQ